MAPSAKLSVRSHSHAQHREDAVGALLVEDVLQGVADRHDGAGRGFAQGDHAAHREDPAGEHRQEQAPSADPRSEDRADLVRGEHPRQPMRHRASGPRHRRVPQARR